jgi:hypothetical protein
MYSRLSADNYLVNWRLFYAVVNLCFTKNCTFTQKSRDDQTLKRAEFEVYYAVGTECLSFEDCELECGISWGTWHLLSRQFIELGKIPCNVQKWGYTELDEVTTFVCVEIVSFGQFVTKCRNFKFLIAVVVIPRNLFIGSIPLFQFYKQWPNFQNLTFVHIQIPKFLIP